MAERENCERCGESYHEENIDVCAKCRKMVCPRCAGSVSLFVEGALRTQWRCDGCREERRHGHDSKAPEWSGKVDI